MAPTVWREPVAAADRTSPGSRWAPVGLAAIVLVAAALRVWPWLRPHTFGGVLEYDDGVYYAAGRDLLHGLLPYRDVVVLQPPLTVLLLTPFAALGALTGDRVGMESARVAVVLLSLVTVGLLWTYGRRHLRGAGIWSAAVCAGAYAVYPGAVATEHTVLLEPFLNLIGTIVALLVLAPATRRRLAAAGLLIGAAVLIKLFAVAYLVAAIGFLALHGRRRGLPALLGGFAVAVGAVAGPFLALAPHRLIRDVVVTQLQRPADGGLGIAARLSDQLGLSALLGHPAPLPAVVVVSVLAAGCAVVLWQLDRPARFWLLVLAVGVAGFAVSGSYFTHYSDFLAPGLAVALATAVTVARRRGSGAAQPALAGALVVIVAFGVGAWRPLHRWSGQGDLTKAAATIPTGDCVYTDSVSLLIATDRFRPPSRDCPSWADGRGVALSRYDDPDLARYYPTGFRTSSWWQRQTLRQLEAAQFVLTRSDPRTIAEWTSAPRTYVAVHFHPVAAWRGRFPWQLWARDRPHG